MPIDELRHLAESLQRLGAAAGAADWDDDAALFWAEAEARAELATMSGGADIAAAAADPLWRGRAENRAGHPAPEETPSTPEQARANAVVAVGLARVADRLARCPVVDEVRHLLADSPRAVLARVAITLAIALSLVTFYHVTGFTRYDDAGRLTLYLFSAVVGSVICTNALCNLAMAALLSLTGDVSLVQMIDQLVTVVFIWLGVGNVLSVIYPLRHEPVWARLHDGTWKPFLGSFALSYRVGLTVNLMIYWRLWAKYKASSELTGGAWAAFTMVLASAVAS